MNKIYEWMLKNVDKILHLTVSYMLASLFGIWLAVIAGIAKEVYDLYIKKSKFSIADIVADALGIALAFWIVGV